MILSDLVGIIADDLTGANDTALQFQQSLRSFPQQNMLREAALQAP